MSQPSGWNRVLFCICPLSLCDRRSRRPTGSGRPRYKPQFAVRRTHATSCDYPQPRIGGELDGFCGMRTGLEPKDIGADRNRLARDGLGLCWRTEYIDDVDRRVDLLQGGYTCSPNISPPLGFTGMIRYPCDWR